MIVELQANERWGAIDELIDGLVSAGKILAKDREAIASAIRKRELAMTTGIGFGIAIPHASTELFSDVVHVVGRSTKGIDFSALDGKPFHKVCLFPAPQGQIQKHLHTLSNFAKMLHQDDFE